MGTSMYWLTGKHKFIIIFSKLFKKTGNKKNNLLSEISDVEAFRCVFGTKKVLVSTIKYKRLTRI